MRNYQLFIHILNDFPSRKKSKKERSEMFHYQLSKTSFLQLPSESITFPMHCYSKSTRLFRFISSIIIHMPNEFPSRKKYEERSDDVFLLLQCFSSSFKVCNSIPLIFLQNLPLIVTNFIRIFNDFPSRKKYEEQAMMFSLL